MRDQGTEPFEPVDTEAQGTPPDPPPDTDTLRDKLIGAALWGAGLGWLIPALGAGTVLYRIVPPDRCHWFSHLYCTVQLAMAGAKWRSVVHPAVRSDRVYMFAQNHTNHLDHVAMYNATPHFKQGLELESHFHYPFYGWFMKARGTIPVPDDKRRRFRAILRSMKQEVAAGHSLLVFPEGTRTVDGRVGPFKRGVFHMARHLGLEVVPTAVTGTFEVMRKGSWVLHPGKTVTVYIEEPVPTAGLSDRELLEAMDKVRTAIAARVDAYFDEGVNRT